MLVFNMFNKKQARLRRAAKVRARIADLKATRLTVHRSNVHMYAQVISADGKVLASASTLDKETRAVLEQGKSSNVAAAVAVGKAIAERALKAGVTNVAFDRSGFAYHGRVKALADAAREAGLKF